MLYLRINNRCSSSGVCFLHCVFCFVKDSMHIRLAGGGEMEGGCFILCLFAFFNCAAGCCGEPEGYNSSHSVLSWTTELQLSCNCFYASSLPLLTTGSVEHDLDSSFSRLALQLLHLIHTNCIKVSKAAFSEHFSHWSFSDQCLCHISVSFRLVLWLFEIS